MADCARLAESSPGGVARPLLPTGRTSMVETASERDADRGSRGSLISVRTMQPLRWRPNKSDSGALLPSSESPQPRIKRFSREPADPFSRVQSSIEKCSIDVCACYVKVRRHGSLA